MIVYIFSFVSEYVEAFKCFDLNKNGHLSTKELKYAMRMLGLNPTALEVQELVNGLDYEGKRKLHVNIVKIESKMPVYIFQYLFSQFLEFEKSVNTNLHWFEADKSSSEGKLFYGKIVFFSLFLAKRFIIPPFIS